MENRIIPILLYRKDGLYKGIRFKDYKYVGDPLNAIRVFSEKEVDELVLLDIEATLENKSPNIDFISKVAEECYMPFAIGGGIKDVGTIRQILKAGAEKVVINSAAVNNPKLIKAASEEFGRTTIIGSVDYKKDLFGNYRVYCECGTKKSKYTVFEYASLLEEMGAGEIIVNSVDRDGTGVGLDLENLKKITEKLSIPVIACGGVGSTKHINEGASLAGVAAVAAGSFFVFKGSGRSVLITYTK
jgi:imidazole glycerol-phosphate synthase subunit HisF